MCAILNNKKMKINTKTKRIMKSKILMLLMMITLITFSCSSDDDEGTTTQTKATITVLDENGDVVNGMSVYAYKENTWITIGDDPLFSDKTVSTGGNGKAVFNIDDIHMIFATSDQENVHFSVHYTLSGVDKTKVTSITFSKEDEKTATLTLN